MLWCRSRDHRHMQPALSPAPSQIKPWQRAAWTPVREIVSDASVAAVSPSSRPPRTAMERVCDKCANISRAARARDDSRACSSWARSRYFAKFTKSAPPPRTRASVTPTASPRSSEMGLARVDFMISIGGWPTPPTGSRSTPWRCCSVSRARSSPCSRSYSCPRSVAKGRTNRPPLQPRRRRDHSPKIPSSNGEYAGRKPGLDATLAPLRRPRRGSDHRYNLAYKVRTQGSSIRRRQSARREAMLPAS